MKNLYRIGTLFLVLITGCSWARPASDAERKSEIKVSHENYIKNIYIGQRQADGTTELVFEFEGHKFLFNQSTYSCIFVDGKIVSIKEYNKEDSYVRGIVQLNPQAETITAYSGVLSHVTSIDPHDHNSLWKAFLDSPRKPFTARKADLPEWWIRNPIQQRKLQAKQNPPTLTKEEFQQQRIRLMLASDGYPHVSAEDRPYIIREALAGNFQATWGLAISGYSPEAAEALLQIATDETHKSGNRDYAAMGLRNFSHSLTADQKAKLQTAFHKVVMKERLKTSAGIITLLLDLGDATFLYELLGNELKNHPSEIDILQRLPDETANARLWQIYQETKQKSGEEKQKQNLLSIIDRVGSALTQRKDKRGIDILLTLLPKESGAVDQWRNNIFCFIARNIGQNFDYPDGNYRPELEKAIPRLTQWWQENRDTFHFPAK